VHQRIRAVLLIAEGSSVAEAAAITGLSIPSVYRWLEQYREHRAACRFTDADRSGRPPIVLPLSDEQLCRLIEESPLEHGYMSTGWTVGLLCRYFGDQHDIAIGQDAMRERLHELGLRWKRPRFVFTNAEPHLAQKKGASYAV
jgi:transposase